MAALWAQVLKRERVGRHDNFFELGGHSLLVTQVVSRLRSEFQVDLALRTMFEHPTVAGVALAIAQQHAERDERDALGPMLAELEEISDEEAERLLKTEARPND
ncbi:MAG: phosphopantetheine-binding protein [Acidobacteria bacterium]|nr:phosphopantetheine-binding protein [Acidobacteriota bacterium]